MSALYRLTPLYWNTVYVMRLLFRGRILGLNWEKSFWESFHPWYSVTSTNRFILHCTAVPRLSSPLLSYAVFNVWQSAYIRTLAFHILFWDWLNSAIFLHYNSQTHKMNELDRKVGAAWCNVNCDSTYATLSYQDARICFRIHRTEITWNYLESLVNSPEIGLSWSLPYFI